MAATPTGSPGSPDSFLSITPPSPRSPSPVPPSTPPSHALPPGTEVKMKHADAILTASKLTADIKPPKLSWKARISNFFRTFGSRKVTAASRQALPPVGVDTKHVVKLASSIPDKTYLSIVTFLAQLHPSKEVDGIYNAANALRNPHIHSTKSLADTTSKLVTLARREILGLHEEFHKKIAVASGVREQGREAEGYQSSRPISTAVEFGEIHYEEEEETQPRRAGRPASVEPPEKEQVEVPIPLNDQVKLLKTSLNLLNSLTNLARSAQTPFLEHGTKEGKEVQESVVEEREIDFNMMGTLIAGMVESLTGRMDLENYHGELQLTQQEVKDIRTFLEKTLKKVGPEQTELRASLTTALEKLSRIIKTY